MRYLSPVLLAAVTCCHAQIGGLVCYPSSPAANPGDSVRLQSFATAAPGAKPVYRWTVSSGAVRSTGPNTFLWTLDKSSSGPQTADGEVSDGGKVLDRCLVEVITSASLAANTKAGLLTAGQPESPNAGLYSYLLFAGPTTSSNRAQRLAAATAWLALIPALAELLRIQPPAQANSLPIPVTELASSTPDADWLLSHYDYARAQSLLERPHASLKSGLFIVSTRQPLAEAKPPFLFQDLTAATPEMTSHWIEAFLNQAAQEHSWTPVSEAALVDQLRSTLRWIAPGIPKIDQLASQWISLR